MVDFKAGPKEAAKMLAGLPKEQREAALEKIALKDPQMAEVLDKLITTFNDLKYMSLKMLQELLREISLKDLAYALRIQGPDLRDFFLKNISSSMRSEIEEVLLGPPIPVSKAEEAIERIMKVVLLKVDKGELVLRKDADEYV